jgi:hypothetical protein
LALAESCLVLSRRTRQETAIASLTAPAIGRLKLTASVVTAARRPAVRSAHARSATTPRSAVCDGSESPADFDSNADSNDHAPLATHDDSHGLECLVRAPVLYPCRPQKTAMRREWDWASGLVGCAAGSNPGSNREAGRWP